MFQSKYSFVLPSLPPPNYNCKQGVAKRTCGLEEGLPEAVVRPHHVVSGRPMVEVGSAELNAIPLFGLVDICSKQELLL